MPLFEMTHNIQRETAMDANGLKRSHDEFSGDEVSIDDRGLDAGVKQQATEGVVQASKAMSPALQITRGTPPPQSSPASLTDAGTSTPARNSPSPNPTPTKNGSPLKQATTSNPSTSTPSAAQPAKRKRRTAAEKEAEEREKAQKKKEREEKKEAKEAEKAKAEAEKAKHNAEKAKAAAEKAKVVAEKQAEKEEKRRKKEAEENEKRRKKEEEEREREKKERAQPKLMSFFAKATPSKTPVTPKKEQASVKTESPANDATPSKSAPATPVKEEKSEYEKKFKPFFVHHNVRMAENPFEMDDETRTAKSNILDEYLEGKRGEVKTAKLDPVEVFQLPCRPAPRGRIYPPVRHTIERMQSKLSQKGEGISEEDKKVIMLATTNVLRKIPVKSLRFWQDVRPPYRGTVTLKPYQAGKAGMRRLARKPTLRDQVPVNYEHDSEAEWESEGEDVDVDDDDEEDLDDDDEMEDFVDDSEDTGPARFVSANGLEPESTGLCWEDGKRVGPVRTMYEHKMEFILESIDRHTGIDPFSTKYWEPEPKAKTGRPPKDKKEAADAAPPANAFAAMGGTNKAPVPVLPKKILENDHLQELKKVIQANPKLTKGGLIDLSYVALSHAKVSRHDVKEAIAAIAERTGRGAAGSWTVKPGYD
ncbi:chromatin assembly factor 1 subunit a [Colletotrichum plurivorum]|uniref:Chromatin assembly factor 1 subunit a n=1 Tax=Colletotrichum plurivorum TaxID=2175906 RepID=A0A8H6KEM8_9PEZI|nr:chromatin assembly factor 1 subunit a [Colletotrichum plurivorum]